MPRFKHSAAFSESPNPYKVTYNNLLPAFDPDFKKRLYSSLELPAFDPDFKRLHSSLELLPAFHENFKPAKKFSNFVTPLPDDKSEANLNEINVEAISQELHQPHMSLTKLLYSLNKSEREEVDKKAASEMENMEIQGNISEDSPEKMGENTGVITSSDPGPEERSDPDTEEGSGDGSGDDSGSGDVQFTDSENTFIDFSVVHL